MHRVDAVGNSLEVHRELAEGIGSSPGWRKKVRQKKIETRRKIVEGRRKACRDVCNMHRGDQGVVMVPVLFSLRLEVDLWITMASWPFLDRNPSIGFACPRAISSGDRPTHDDINLLFDWLHWTRSMIFVVAPFGGGFVVSDIAAEVPLADQVLNLIF
ncbi:hypothetical protein GW17_00062380 [Ensete ventricosum]|nr:hypothetical protein GW17_00062380 [Ensete ventricosum]